MYVAHMYNTTCPSHSELDSAALLHVWVVCAPDACGELLSTVTHPRPRLKPP